jgi:hypothetical protein
VSNKIKNSFILKQKLTQQQEEELQLMVSVPNHKGSQDMAELTNGVSWLAVVAGAVVSFLAGWLWYSTKMFGLKWAEGVGLGLGSSTTMPAGAMISQLIGLLLMSWFVGVTAASSALLTVILATVAFTVLAYSGGMFSKKSGFVRLVDAGYWILCLVIMVLSQGIIRGAQSP